MQNPFQNRLQQLSFMMNKSKVIRSFPRAVHFPIAVWSQGVFAG